MQDGLSYACPECGEEFIVSVALYVCADWILTCPCCGSVDVRLDADDPRGASLRIEAA